MNLVSCCFIYITSRKEGVLYVFRYGKKENKANKYNIIIVVTDTDEGEKSE